jgi:predicted nucleic acid-binding protein
MKPLTNLPPNVDIFIDANLLAYFFVRRDTFAQHVAQFLKRAVDDELRIHSSTQVVSDVIHRVMLSEAVRTFKLEPSKAAQYLKTHPERVKALRENLNIPSRVYHELGINILPVTHIELHSSRRFRTEYGLLANDSIIAATMRNNKITHLATNDHDFERVTEIQVWSL